MIMIFKVQEKNEIQIVTGEKIYLSNHPIFFSGLNDKYGPYRNLNALQ